MNDHAASNSPTPAASPETGRSARRQSPWRRVGDAISSLRTFTVNTLFLLLLAFVAVTLIANCQGVSIPDNSALVINPRGIIVEARRAPLALQDLVTPGARMLEVELDTVLTAIDTAASDSNIHMIVLDLDELAYASPAHTRRIGRTLGRFREAGKKVVAYGYFYSQAQYHIASHADAVYMHPMGQVVLQGYGGFNFYLKDLLERLDVNVHVFRAGVYKSAVEPLTRNDMSEDARMDAEALYKTLWQSLIGDLAVNRQLPVADVEAYAAHLADAVDITRGDLGRAALEAHLIDELLTSDQARVRIADDVGYNADGSDINAIEFNAYLEARSVDPHQTGSGDGEIAVLVAQGPIMVDGADLGATSAQTTVNLIREARLNQQIRALVLRVDSPGGSQFASELIRQELELFQLSGKPVVASLASSAASGGYWIAATADAIVAEATTVTGSIGIFSFVTTFEKTLERFGVHSDGVGTTPNTLGMSPFTGLSPDIVRLQQARVQHGYDQFVHLVARGRNKEVDEVAHLAQARLWSGEDALDLGLVDALGGMDIALQRAAELAGLETWGKRRLMPPVDPRSRILAELLAPGARSASTGALRPLVRAWRALEHLDDPHQVYALCPACWQGSY